MNNDNIIVTTPSQLQAMITAAVRSAVVPTLSELRKRRDPEITSDNLPLPDAVKFLNEHGCPIKQKHIYNLVYWRKIPYRKCGQRLVFSRTELLQWIEERTLSPEEYHDKVVQRIVNIANLKKE